MTLKTVPLLQELEKVCKNQFFGSESEYPIVPFVWTPLEQGILTPANLLISEGFLYQKNIDEIFPQNLRSNRLDLLDDIPVDAALRQQVINFIASGHHSLDEINPNQIENPPLRRFLSSCDDATKELLKNDQKQQIFLDFLKLNCKSIETYFASKNDAGHQPGDEFEAFPLIIAETVAGSWMGIMPDVHSDSSACRTVHKHRDIELYQSQPVPIDAATTVILEDVRVCLSDMTFITRQFYELDYEMDEFWVEFANSKEQLLSRLLYVNGFINIYEFSDFSVEPDALQPLDQLLRAHLTDIREYVVGCMSVFYLYDVGQTIDGHWVGVQTTAVWT